MSNFFQLKSIKYKKKYLALKKQLGGHYLHDLLDMSMPQLCFGTVQPFLEYSLPIAFNLGYRHIDGAEVYEEAHASYGSSAISYKTIIKNEIKKIPRNQLWITWKDNNITSEKIKRICDELECGYIDLFLIHHGCGSENDFIEFKKAKVTGLIRNYGVSNCENLETIRHLKTVHNIFANQIQARPPNGSVSGKGRFNPSNFIEECNKIGVITMLYGTMSGILNIPQDNRKSINPYLELINEYYMQKYIIGNNNVLIVGSLTGASLGKIYQDFLNLLSEKEKLEIGIMRTIENRLETLLLTYQ